MVRHSALIRLSITILVLLVGLASYGWHYISFFVTRVSCANCLATPPSAPTETIAKVFATVAETFTITSTTAKMSTTATETLTITSTTAKVSTSISPQERTKQQHAAARYLSEAYMDAPKVTVVDWYASIPTPRFFVAELPTLPKASFNPAFIKLPPSLAHALHPQAYFVGTLRHIGDQCFLGNTSSLRGRMKGRSVSIGSSAVIWDRDLRPLLSAPFTIHGAMTKGCEDARLFAMGDRVLVHCMSYGNGPSMWTLYELKLSNSKSGKTRGLTASVEEWGERTRIRDARNMGLFAEGTHLKMLMWASYPHVDVRPLRATTTASMPHEYRWHNNINPVHVGGGLMLGIAHAHKHQKPALFGSHYVHFFFLFEEKEPYKMVRRSEAFCFPAKEDISKCEFIQFVSGLIVDGPELFIGFGVNDCEAAVVRMRTETVLEFTRRSNWKVTSPSLTSAASPATVPPSKSTAMPPL